MQTSMYLTLVLWQSDKGYTRGLARLSRDVCVFNEAKTNTYKQVVYFTQLIPRQ